MKKYNHVLLNADTFAPLGHGKSFTTPLYFIRDYSGVNDCITINGDEILTFQTKEEAYKYAWEHKLDPIRFCVHQLQ